MNKEVKFGDEFKYNRTGEIYTFISYVLNASNNGVRMVLYKKGTYFVNYYHKNNLKDFVSEYNDFLEKFTLITK